ncbi:MAG: DUF3108 domain-containing protein [Bradyrhizobium sp.]|uniref:DUF3108 domain-containing protein n=1 Tax=Bradyrhizobium sp. TaxID=376 RepID=UPI002A307934|nr:DUF3108 domain-containing protein [Bradyrhizobium sp.]
MLAAAGIEVKGAEVRLDASYGVTVAGIPIGAISGSLDIDERRFNVMAEGATTGAFRVVLNGHGEIATSGVRSRGESLPAKYALTTVIRSREEKVRMEFNGRNATSISIDPEPAPNGALLPLTEAHRNRVVDPLTSVLVNTAERGGSPGPEACQRTVPVFDGRVRYDLKLAFKQLASVTTPIGYQGAAVVCQLLFVPIAGHDPDRFLFKYLAEQRDMEVWLVPVAGAGVLVPYRVSIRTPIGLGVMEAKRLEIAKGPTATNVLPESGRR